MAPDSKGQAVWRGIDALIALWAHSLRVCDDAADTVYRGGGKGSRPSSGMVRDRGEAICDEVTVCGWARRRRRAKRRDERPEGP